MQETVGQFQLPDYDHLIVAEDALNMLDGWLEDPNAIATEY
ncbi:hypothetical protein ATJ93_4212 [Halopiger aswanensis]|uniref:Uncharacterized protein n=1 Tax=Halopiger aswanensis TaxID=148449 RepID=A0A3R7D794_9EURY|nr:hypothetical protein ATJ93_4212 [Halopiger aswanensis]